MGLLYAGAFEINSVTNGKDWSTIAGATFQTGVVRSGTRAGLIGNLVSGTAQYFRFQSTAANSGPFFYSVPVYIANLPSAENRFIAVSNSATAGTGVMAYLTLDGTGAVRLYDEDGQIGSASSPLSTGQWYVVGVQFDKTLAGGSNIVRARINYVEFAGATNRNISSGVGHLFVGLNLNAEAQSSAVDNIYIDDVTIYNTTGTYDNTWAGDRSLDVLYPSAAGDNSDWVRGGTDSGANWSQVDENPTTDITDYVSSNTTGQVDTYNLTDTPGAIASDAVIKSVSVSVRFAGAGASANASFRVGLKAGGSTVYGSTITPTNATWRTNDPGGNLLVPSLVSYVHSATGARWTKADLDSLQVALELTASSTNAARVSAVWVTVEYAPAFTGGDKFLQLFN